MNKNKQFNELKRIAHESDHDHEHGKDDKDACTITPDISQKLTKGEDVPEPVYICMIKDSLNKFPWKNLGMAALNIPVTGQDNSWPMSHLQFLKEFGNRINRKTGEFDSILLFLTKLNSKNFKEALQILHGAKDELSQFIKHNDSYIHYSQDQKGQALPTDISAKLQHWENTGFPAYFPQPWHATNVGKDVTVSGGGGVGCGPWLDYKKFRNCMTPKYNHFLMWGPNVDGTTVLCPQCGMGGTDPRLLMLKGKYPNAFTYEMIKLRMKHHMWHPVIPSPGMKPYVAPPPCDVVYSDPNNPDTRPASKGGEGVRWFSSQDCDLWHKWYEKYIQFKKQELDKVETFDYIKKFLCGQYANKLTKSLVEAPNEWSASHYGGERFAPKGKYDSRQHHATISKEHPFCKEIAAGAFDYTKLKKLSEKFGQYLK